MSWFGFVWGLDVSRLVACCLNGWVCDWFRGFVLCVFFSMSVVGCATEGHMWEDRLVLQCFLLGGVFFLFGWCYVRGGVCV